MQRAVACTAAMMVATVALDAHKDNIRGLRIGMTSAQIQDVLPTCGNAKIFIDERSLHCAVMNVKEVLEVDLTNKGRAYVIEYRFASDRTYEEVYEEMKSTRLARARWIRMVCTNGHWTGDPFWRSAIVG
jgi:hypothetical protein